MSSSSFQAVVFDLFGTLVPTLSLRGLRAVLGRMADAVGADGDRFARLWIDTFDERAVDVAGTIDGSIQGLCQQIGVTCDPERVKAAAETWFDFMRRALEPESETIDVLARLRAAGLRTGLASDCTAEVPALWERTPLAALIEVPIFSCVVGLRKPDPGIFRMACERLAADPGHCLYVGDGSNRELEAASALGMHAVLIRLREEDPSDAFRAGQRPWHGPAVSSLAEILPLAGVGDA